MHFAVVAGHGDFAAGEDGSDKGRHLHGVTLRVALEEEVEGQVPAHVFHGADSRVLGKLVVDADAALDPDRSTR